MTRIFVIDFFQGRQSTGAELGKIFEATGIPAHDGLSNKFRNTIGGSLTFHSLEVKGAFDHWGNGRRKDRQCRGGMRWAEFAYREIRKIHRTFNDTYWENDCYCCTTIQNRFAMRNDILPSQLLALLVVQG